MARYAIKKVDSKGKVIKNFKVWRVQNPDALYHDSKLNYNFYEELIKRGIKFDYQRTFLLQETFSDLVWCERSVNKEKVLGWHRTSIQAITWSPDFVLTDYNIVIEGKGRANDAFPNKLKMFRFVNKVENLNLKVVVLYSMKELLEFLDKGLKFGTTE